MRLDEFMALRPGDPIVFATAGRLAKGTVVEAPEQGKGTVRVRRDGFVRAGWKYPSIIRNLNQVWPQTVPDPLSANVYADWLEEHGEEKAAEMLRAAFPLAAPAGVAAHPD